jgi:uncharacterized membrane protein (TIGR02234 family)
MKMFAAALVAQVVGAAAVLLIATREWQTITTVRAHPFADDVVGVSGRTVDGAVTALALVALAGVVAIIATKGIARRVIGGLVAASGVALVWRIIIAIPAVDAARARDLVRAAHPQVAGAPHVTTHVVWGVLSLLGAVLVLVAGLLTAVRGGQWAGLSARYDRREIDPEQARARADASLWTALERGDDPTEHDPREAR